MLSSLWCTSLGVMMARVIRKELARAKVYDTTVAETHCFFAASRNGVRDHPILVHNCHRMGIGAQDVLLKPLEEKRMVGIFCTTEPEKIRGPIRSRCEEYTIRKVTREDILTRMREVLIKEKVEFQDDAVLIVIDYSAGHVRDVLNKLEMIAQIGPITVESVREHLRLSVISTYYEILLALAEPKKSVELVDQACEKVSPEDVAAGLAEAAMNSYRVANGMFTDSVSVDRELAKRIYDKYSTAVIRFAEWFLRSRYVTRISLVRDVLVFAQTTGNLPLETTQPPVVIVGSPVPQAASTVVAPAVVAPAPTAVPGSNGESKRYLSLHTADQKLEVAKPRMNDRDDVHLVFPATSREDERRILAPEEWRRLFERAWRGVARV